MAAQVSVVMPVYNCERYLDEAIRSIRAQTFGDFEFIIINDGSTDGSLEIIRRHAAEDPRIVVLDRPNGGIVDALNAGLNIARGTYIARMDADDVSLPERLQRQVEALEQDPELAIVGSDAAAVTPQGLPLMRFAVSLEHAEIWSQLLEGRGTAMIHPAVMMRFKSIQQVGGYRQECCWAEDLDLFLRLSEVGKLRNLPEILLLYRQHDAAVTKSSSDRCWHYSCLALQDFATRRPDLAGKITMPGRWQCDPIAMRLGWIREMLFYRQRRAACVEASRLLFVKPISRTLWRAWALILLSLVAPKRVQAEVKHSPRFMGELLEQEEFDRLISLGTTLRRNLSTTNLSAVSSLAYGQRGAA